MDAFLTGQSAISADGQDEAAVDELLAEDVTWHVPGMSPFAGNYRGRVAVLRHLRFRRSLAAQSHVRLANDDVDWRTAGVYRVIEGKIAEAWSVPFDQQSFEGAWAAARPKPFVYAQRVRPQDCAASTMLGHPRLLEFFEAAFIECWRDRFGQIDASLGRERSLTVGAIRVNYIAGVRSDAEVEIAVSLDRISLDRITKRSITVHYDTVVDATKVAEATARYVCVDKGGKPALLPDAITRR